MKMKLLLVTMMVVSICTGVFAQQKKAKMQYFGEKIKAKNAISYDVMLDKLATTEPLKVKVRGKVQSVCQEKGCWMTIVSDDKSKPVMFVKFKDYAFFVPKNIQGKEAIVEGEAYYEETSVKELKHYAEDEGKSKAEIDAITEPKRELKFMASGVIIIE